MDHEEIADLLGAYALDALEPEEADAVASHLETCPRCRQEVDEHLEAAAALALAGETAPDGLWDRIHARLEEAPPELDMAPIVPMRGRPPSAARDRRSSVLRAAGLVAAAAAAVVIAVLAVQVADLRSKVNGGVALPNIEGAVTVSMRSPDGNTVVPAVLARDGTGYVISGDLPALPAGRTYQLWKIVDGRRVSVGVLGPSFTLSPFQAEGRIDTLAITNEAAPGATTSEEAPVVFGQVPRTA